ncbi:MAG TPA: hypothetical protein VL359_06415 [bacterium]|nr:hypothetical protein [bacterium]
MPINAVLAEGRLQRLAAGPPEYLVLPASVAADLPARVTGVRVQASQSGLPGLQASDVLVLDPARTPEPGTWVLAQMGAELRYGRWFAESGRVAVVNAGAPAESDWKEARLAQVLGVAVGLWRVLS